jgi:hypothetical protein
MDMLVWMALGYSIMMMDADSSKLGCLLELG